MWKYKNNNLDILYFPTFLSGPHIDISSAKIRALEWQGKSHGVEKQNMFRGDS